MAIWLVFAAIATIALTGALTWVLWRLNAAPHADTAALTDGDAGDRGDLGGDK